MSNITPMMRQYRRIKQQHGDAVLFFRLGDFYEMFEQDAKEVSRILDLTLTRRNGIPMCGIPYHAASSYIARLIKSGKKIAICEQTHLPKPGQGLAKREVVEVVTPGTLIDENLLEGRRNNYLAALGRHGSRIAFAYIDLSTAEFLATSFIWQARAAKLREELHRLSPRELIVQESLLDDDDGLERILREREGLVLNRLPDWSFDLETSRRELARQFGVASLKGFGLQDDSPELIAAGVILDYLRSTSKGLLPHLKSISVYDDSSFVGLDEATQKNLELVQNLQDGSKRYTLLEVLDHCRTSMGARKLRRWILAPILDRDRIENRLGTVDFFYRNQILLTGFREQLGRVLDLERLSTRVAMDKAHAKDLLAIRDSIAALQSTHDLVSGYSELASFSDLQGRALANVAELKSLLDRSILDEPSVQLTEGKIIKRGFHAELDRLKSVKENARDVLSKLLEEEREKTGISSLKLKYNRIIGYFFEVTKSHLARVPDYFVRRQSLVGSERFATDSLSALESEINNASEKLIEIERRLFLEIRGQAKEHIASLMDLAGLISEIDVLQSFAFAATVHGYCHPRLRVFLIAMTRSCRSLSQRALCGRRE